MPKNKTKAELEKEIVELIDNANQNILKLENAKARHLQIRAAAGKMRYEIFNWCSEGENRHEALKIIDKFLNLL